MKLGKRCEGLIHMDYMTSEAKSKSQKWEPLRSRIQLEIGVVSSAVM